MVDMGRRTHKGTFKPKNPGKYAGNSSNIVYRSGWEKKFMLFLDSHPDILEWSSEEVQIPYRSPIDGRIHRYFPDFKVKKRSIDGKIETLIIEIKPEAQTKEPTKRTKVTQKYINEVVEWGRNSAKWAAANEYCLDRNIKFQILTEKDLGIKY
jgi:hypothetical protein